MGKTKRLKPIHPGEILLEEFLRPMLISQYRLAKDIHVPPRRINEIVLGKRGISADTALRLARYFGTSVDVWMALQARYEVEEARDAEGGLIEHEIHPFSALGRCVRRDVERHLSLKDQGDNRGIAVVIH